MHIGVWRSLVAHLFWVQVVGGSNPLAPTSLTSFTLLSHSALVAQRKSSGLLSHWSQVRILPGAFALGRGQPLEHKEQLSIVLRSVVSTTCICSSVGRAPDFESVGRRFEPCQVRCGLLAQSVEHRTLNPLVEGSSPSWPTK